MSGVKCKVSGASDKALELFGGGAVINGAYSSSFDKINIFFSNFFFFLVFLINTL